MRRTATSVSLLILLLASTPVVALDVRLVKAQGTIYIRADGSVDPPTAPIMRDLDVYTFTDNIYDEIVVERSDVVVDGGGYNLSASALYNGYGLSWSSIDNVTIQNINIQRYLWGVYMYSSSFSSVTGNNITNCGEGVVIDPLSSNNTVSRNNITNFGWCAIDLYNDSSNTTVLENIIIGNRDYNSDGVYIESSSFNIVSGNNITNCRNYGIAVYDSSKDMISGNNVTGNYRGIYLESSTNSTISDNSVMDSSYSGYYLSSGIFFESSYNNTICDNSVMDCNNGVCLHLSSNNVVYRNIIENASEHGIGLFDSSDNTTVSENNIRNCSFGVALESSSKNVLRNNIMVENKYGFGVSGDQTLSHFINDVDLSNRIDNKPIYYLINQKNFVVDPSTCPNAGYLALVNSTYITVNGLELRNSTQGILLAYTENSQITNSDIADNYVGVDLAYSSNNTVVGNNVTSNYYGVYLYHSPFDNRIYHNNFVNNEIQALSYGYPNALDNGYPSGGNYWSDYTGSDANGDGIGDTPRIFDPNNKDRHPLMNPWPSHDVAIPSLSASKNIVVRGDSVLISVSVADQGDFPEDFRLLVYGTDTIIYTQDISMPNRGLNSIAFNWNTTDYAYGTYNISAYVTAVPSETDVADNTCTDGTLTVTILGDINGDGRIDSSDLTILSNAYGSIQPSPEWNPICDLNDDGRIDALDLYELGRDYGKP